MADGEEERRDQEQKQERESWREREDRVDRDRLDPWEPERDDS